MLTLLIVGILATHRVTSLLHYENGPHEVFERLRRRIRAFEEDEDGKPMTFLGGLFSCFACLSVWTALLVGAISLQIMSSPKAIWFVLYSLAYSAGAIVIDSFIAR